MTKNIVAVTNAEAETILSRLGECGLRKNIEAQLFEGQGPFANWRHLVAVSIGTFDDPGDISELVDFVIENIGDPELPAWLEGLKNGQQVDAGGGAAETRVLRPIFQAHIVE